MHIIRRRQCRLHTSSKEGKQSSSIKLCHANINVSHPNSPSISNLFSIRCWSLRWVCIQFMGNLRSATLEISALLSTRRAGIIHPLSFLLPTFVSLFCIFSFVLQIPGKTVRLDKGHNRQRASSDRHNSHPRCPVLPALPYGSPVRDTEVSEVSLSEVTVDFVPGTELPRVHATTWRTQTGRWQ